MGLGRKLKTVHVSVWTILVNHRSSNRTLKLYQLTLEDSGESNSFWTSTNDPQLPIASLLPAAQEVFSEYLGEIDVRRDLLRVQLWHSNLTKIGLAPEPVSRIRDWLTSADASMLWLRGHISHRQLVNPISALAANVILAAQAVRLPTVYYFCGLHLCSGRTKIPTITILTSFVLQALEWRDEFAPDSSIETRKAIFTKERLSQALTSESIWELFDDVMKLLPKPPVIVIDLLDVYHRYDSEVTELIGQLLTLVPALSVEENGGDNLDKMAGCPKSSIRAYKILITSKTASPLLSQTIPQEVMVNIIDSPRWRVSRNAGLQLGESLIGDTTKVGESDHSLSDDSESSSDGWATS
jgi:hypothetical protein